MEGHIERKYHELAAVRPSDSLSLSVERMSQDEAAPARILVKLNNPKLVHGHLIMDADEAVRLANDLLEAASLAEFGEAQDV